MLGTWSMPQHSPARCHLPLLSLLVTLPEPWGCSHTQPCPWRHCPCPCLAPVTVTPVPGVAATSPLLLPCRPGATCRRPATPPGSPRLRRGSGALPARLSRVCLTWADKGAAVPRPRRHKAFPVGARLPRAAAGAGGAGGIPRFRRGWARQQSRSAVPCHASARHSLHLVYSCGFAVPRVSPLCPSEGAFGGHPLCHAVPAAGRRACCGDCGPGDTECLVLLGNVPAATRHQVNTGDR